MARTDPASKEIDSPMRTRFAAGDFINSAYPPSNCAPR